MKKKWKLAPNKIIAPAVFGLLVFAGGAWVGGFAGNKTDTDAISAMDFNHGRIIDDAIFYNKDAMSVAQIEQFLREKGPACDINGDKYDARAVNAKAGTTRRDYALYMARNGSSYYHAPPYICVNNYYENPVTKKTSFDTWGQPFEGGQSAAQIIYNAAQSYGINPQVILVTLKKEWSYTYTDEWPMRSDYNTVMGYGCPDTGPNGSANCSAKYYGFYNQVNNAAWQFKQYRDYPGNYNYRAGRWSSIGYNVAARGCGYRDVYIENAATAALYNYTPYVPNDAALRAYPGTGDYCSTYGNRNFYVFWGEWFGSTQNNVKFVPLESSRWMQLIDRTNKVSVYSDESCGDLLDVGRQIKFIDKIFIRGMWYLRTEHDYNNNVSCGIPQHYIADIQFKNLPHPLYFIVNQEGNKSVPNRRSWASSLSRGTIVKAVQTISVDGNLYYRTDSDYASNDNLGVIARQLDAFEFISLDTPRSFYVGKRYPKVDVITNDIKGYVDLGSVIYVTKKVRDSTKWYFQQGSDSGSNVAIDSSILSELDDSQFIPLESPRYMSATADTAKVSLRDLHRGSRLADGQQIFFPSKILLNGEWCLRSQHDTDLESMFCIPMHELR